MAGGTARSITVTGSRRGSVIGICGNPKRAAMKGLRVT